MSQKSTGLVPVPLLTAEQEGARALLLLWRKNDSLNLTPFTDALTRARLTNDERHLRKLYKKFHAFSTALASSSSSVPGSSSTSAVNETRQAFLVELATLQVTLGKNELVCAAEKRQVLEYQQERERICMPFPPLCRSKSVSF